MSAQELADAHEEADVVVVGSGVSGALVAATLARKGVRVLVLEAGAPVDRSQAVQNFWRAAVKDPECAYPPLPEAMHPRSHLPEAWYRQQGPDFFKSTYLKVVGGTTWHWLGTCVRLLPSDFRTRSTHGYGVDWPMRYEALEPFYLRAEHELGVSGDGAHDLGSPRSGPFVMPPIPMTYLDQSLSKALRGTRYEVSATPQARNAVVRGGRPACCGSGSCIPVCPVQAKYDATIHLQEALSLGARLLDRSPVVRLQADEQGRITHAHFRRWDGSRGVARARLFVVACHAIETPRLLLASRTNAYPQGLANRSGLVGRNLMDHPVQLSWALSGSPVFPYRGPLSTSGIENLREGSFRRTRSAFRVEIGNDGWSWPVGAPVSTAEHLARQGLTGARLRQALADEASRHLRLTALTEQLPLADNRIDLDPVERDMWGVPLPRIHYRVDDYARRGMAQARRDFDRIFKRMHATRIQHDKDFFGAGHIMGTTRMGRDPTRSVVDATLRSHEHANLYLVGSGAFPTGGTANPTLTIAALALLSAEAMLRQLPGLPPPDPQVPPT